MLVVSLVVMVIGVIIIFVGWNVRKKGTTAFIAGNNEVFVPKNERKLADRIGSLVMLFGAITILFPIAFQLINGIEGFHFAILAGIHLLFVFIFMLLDQMEI